MKNPLVTIITLNYNGIKDTRKFIPSLLNTSLKEFNLIVADNGSKNNEALILSTEFKHKKLKIVRLDKNYGYSGGNNEIMRTARSKYIALVNNDVIVSKNWLTPLIDQMEEDNSIAMIQPKILWQKNKKNFDYAGACGGFIDAFGYPFTRGRIFNTQEKDLHQYDKSRNIFWASGAAVIIRNSVLKKVGYFDELFFNYMEEIDLCWRILKQGYRVVSEPKSVVYHKVASTAGRNMYKKRLWEHRNNLILIIKHFSIFKLLIIFPVRILMEYLSIFYYLINRKFDFAAGAFMGQISLLFLLPQVIMGRIKEKSISVEENQVKNLMLHGSIVFYYFILGKKKFSDYMLQPANDK